MRPLAPIPILTLVRHGQASYLEPPYDRLTPLGKLQMQRLAAYWLRRRVEFDLVFCGPAERHRQSEQIVREVFQAAGSHWPEAVIIEDFQEFAGEAVVHRFAPELASRSAALQQVLEALPLATNADERRRLLDQLLVEVARRWARGELHDDGIESWDQFNRRIRRALERAREACSGGKRAVAFTSAGPIVAALAAAYRVPLPETMELAFAIFNSAIAEFELHSASIAVRSFNCCPHLEHPGWWTRR